MSENRLNSLMGLLEGGKRVYQVKDGEVDADHYEYCAVLTQLLFGPRGHVETLGPTYEMVHDPRFEMIENLFVVEKRSMFGGDAREGVQVQTADGTFTGGFAGLKQYAEMLGEGRYLIRILRSFSYVEAVGVLFPERSFRTNPKDDTPGITLMELPYGDEIRADLASAIYNVHKDKMVAEPQTFDYTSPEKFWKDLQTTPVDKLWLFFAPDVPDFFEKKGILSPDERVKVAVLAETYEKYKPHALQTWEDDQIWGLLRLEYTNYFSRKGVPNQDAKTLFTILKAGLLGLVTDYAEEANVQEIVLLNDPNTLWEPEKHGYEVGRVSMEVDILERALTYRAELRVTAAQIIKGLGIESQLVEMTDYERDQLLKIVYRSKWPIDKTQMILDVLSYNTSIRFSGMTVEERRTKQLREASESAKKYVAGLKSGEILPINRETDGVAETSVDDHEKQMEKILGNPLFSHLFLRYTNLEGRLAAKQAEFLAPYAPRVTQNDLYRLLINPTAVLDELDKEYPEFKERRKIAAKWVAMGKTAHGSVVIDTPNTEAEIAALFEIERLARAVSVLAPAFTQLDYVLTEESALELFAQVEEIDPTPKPETAQYEGTLDEENRIDLRDPEPEAAPVD
jgi:hypothetical protein